MADVKQVVAFKSFGSAAVRLGLLFLALFFLGLLVARSLVFNEVGGVWDMQFTCTDLAIGFSREYQDLPVL